MLRRLVLLGVALSAVLTAATAAAQATPPHRFFGTLTVNGQPAPVGTTVSVSFGGQQCGSASTTQAGRYVIDVLSATQQSGCFRGGETVSFTVGSATARETSSFRTGGFEELNLTAGGGAATGFNGARLFLDDPRPCIPVTGQATCDAERAALWNADRDAWGRRGITDPQPYIPFEGNVFNETVVFRVQAGDPGVIRNIARIIGNPYLQVTEVKFRGTQANQGDEYVEITNLGGGPQTMAGWVVRSPARDETYTFPSGLTLNGGDSCRVYTGTPGANACGNTSFNRSDLWPDDSGQVILYFAALDLRSAEPLYSADPNNQPAPPNLVGANLP
jgi:hypothetical protein